MATLAQYEARHGAPTPMVGEADLRARIFRITGEAVNNAFGTERSRRLRLARPHLHYDESRGSWARFRGDTRACLQ